MRSFIRMLISVPLLAVCGAVQATALLTIGPDDPGALFPVPRELTALSTAGVASPVATLSDGSQAFNGGLAYRPSGSGGAEHLYAIANDSLGQSTLYRLDVDGGNLTAILSLGVGFTGGLAYDPGLDALYAIQTDLFSTQPGSSLFRVDLTSGPTLTALGALTGIYGGGFGGGLTLNVSDGMLYGTAWDDVGNPRRLNAINRSSASDTTVFDLGDGDLAFNGGLAYDPVSDAFFAIANDFAANSTLMTFLLSGAGTLSAVGASFGQGFLNAGLAFAPEVTPPPPPTVSEPSTLALMLLAAVLGPATARLNKREVAKRRLVLTVSLSMVPTRASA